MKPRFKELDPRQFGEGMNVIIPLDPYLSLKALAVYSSLSVRTLRNYLQDPLHPLPCYRVGRKVLVRQSEFNRWIQQFRDVEWSKITTMVDDLLQSIKSPAREGSQGSPSASRWATKRQPH